MDRLIELIGVCGDTLSSNAKEVLEGCCAVVASKRFSGIAIEHGLAPIPIAPVSEMLEAVNKTLESGSVAVLASGDPLFFGIGRTLIKRFGQYRINIYPALSSLQLACACFKIPWDDMKFLSLHGRGLENSVSTILRSRTTAILTDRKHSPDVISSLLLERLKKAGALDLAEDITVHVGENLGLDDQRLFSGNLYEAAATKFGPLNIMIVHDRHGKISEGNHQSLGINRFPCLGLTEDEIEHSRNLITKNEVRAASLHALRLEPHGCLWDVGAGSGSISIEAAAMCPELSIYSIERADEHIRTIQKNIRKFGYWNINLITGEAPEILSSLPSPDRIFVGGSGGQLEAIIRECVRRLAANGRIVVNAVLKKTAIQAPFLLRSSGLSVSESRISVERLNNGYVTKLNTITIITGKR